MRNIESGRLCFTPREARNIAGFVQGVEQVHLPSPTIALVRNIGGTPVLGIYYPPKDAVNYSDHLAGELTQAPGIHLNFPRKTGHEAYPAETLSTVTDFIRDISWGSPEIDLSVGWLEGSYYHRSSTLTPTTVPLSNLDVKAFEQVLSIFVNSINGRVAGWNLQLNHQ